MKQLILLVLITISTVVNAQQINRVVTTAENSEYTMYNDASLYLEVSKGTITVSGSLELGGVWKPFHAVYTVTSSVIDKEIKSLLGTCIDLGANKNKHFLMNTRCFSLYDAQEQLTIIFYYKYKQQKLWDLAGEHLEQQENQEYLLT